MATLAAPGVSATARSRADVTDHDLVAAVRAGRRPRLRAALPPLSPRASPPTSSAWSTTTAARRTSRRRSSSSALRRMRADRPADRLQAVDLRDRQERVHRRSSGARAAPRRSPIDAEDGRSAPPTTAAASTRPDAGRRGRQQAAARPPARRVRRPVGGPPPDPRHARARGPLLPRDRRAAGHEPAVGRVDAVPRAAAADRGVRGAASPASAACGSRRIIERPTAGALGAARPAPHGAPRLRTASRAASTRSWRAWTPASWRGARCGRRSRRSCRCRRS